MNDPRPPYQQVADDLRTKIRDGELAPGARLSSVRELAKGYGVSPQTMQSALREVRSEGLVVSQQGRAYFVRDPDRPIGGEPADKRFEEIETELRELRARLEALEARL